MYDMVLRKSGKEKKSLEEKRFERWYVEYNDSVIADDDAFCLRIHC